MKKRIEQLLNGKFIYEQPGLLFSQDRIFATLKAGETTKDEIYFGTDDNRRISGFVTSSDRSKLDDSGVILGSRLIVDPKMMGFDVCAHISITLKDPQLLKQTVEQLKEIPEIVEAHFITGSGNILVKLYCVDNEHLMRTIFDGILRIQGIATTETNISLQ